MSKLGKVVTDDIGLVCAGSNLAGKYITCDCLVAKHGQMKYICLKSVILIDKHF